MVTPDMADIWRTGSFAKDAPNATVSVFHKDGGNVSDLVVTLKTAKLEGEKLTFDVDVLEGDLAGADGEVDAVDHLHVAVALQGLVENDARCHQRNSSGSQLPYLGWVAVTGNDTSSRVSDEW